MKLATVVLMLSLIGMEGLSQAKPGGFARQAAMGASQFGSGVVLNPFIMDDPAQIFVNPAYQSMYRDYLFSNIGGGQIFGSSTGNNGYGQQNAGVNFSLGREWSLGAIFSHDPSAVNLVPMLISSPVTQRGEQSIPSVANTWELVGSYDAGALDLGFGLSYGYSCKDSTISSSAPFPVGMIESEASASVLGIRFGANYDMGGGSSIEGAVALRLDKANDILKGDSLLVGPGGTGEYSASATEIMFHARGKMKVSNKVNFVPYAAVAFLTGEPKEDQAPRGFQPTRFMTDLSALAYSVGIGGEYRTPDFYLAGGISYSHADVKLETGDTLKTTNKTSYNALPVVNLGAEWWLTDWLGARIGYTRTIGTLKNELETRGLTTEGNMTMPLSNIFIGGLNPSTWDGLVTLGTSFRFGDFALDATISEEALRRGFGLIGSNDNINTFGYMTASYSFK